MRFFCCFPVVIISFSSEKSPWDPIDIYYLIATFQASTGQSLKICLKKQKTSINRLAEDKT